MEGLREVKDGVVIGVKAKPNSNQTIIYWKGDNFVLDIQSHPENNKANLEAINYLKGLFGCEVFLLRGAKLRNKVFLLKGIKIDNMGTVMKYG